MSYKTLRWGIIVSVGCICASACGQLRVRDRFPLTQIAVEQAIARSLFHQETMAFGVTVHLLSEVVATTPTAELHVAAVLPWTSGSAKLAGRKEIAVRMVCEDAAVCLPFYVRVELPVGMVITGPVLRESMRLSAVSAKPLKRAVVLQRGGHATLILSDGVSQIQIPVSSLQDACLGETVHVVSQSRRHTYEATVVSAGLLKGVF